MDLLMYGYGKCSTCRDAIKWLQGHGHQVTLHDLFEVGAPSEHVLHDLIERSGLPLQKFFNVSGDVYKEMNLKDKVKTMSVDEKIQLLASNGRLVKRPIVTNGTKITVGFKEDLYQEAWGK